MRTSFASLTVLLTCAAALAQIKSGPQVGEEVPGYAVQSVCGPDKGKLGSVR